MSREITPTKERRGIQLTQLMPGDLDAIWQGERDFSNRILLYPESFHSSVILGSNSINGYIDANLDDLKRRPIGFQNSVLAGMYAPNIKLPYANFTLSDLTDADLSGADLREAKFIGANLEKTEFSGADLSGADLRDSKGIESAYFQDTNYEGVIIRPKQLNLFLNKGFNTDKMEVKDFVTP